MPDQAAVETASTIEEEKKLLKEISEQYSKAETAHKEIRDGGFTWNDREELFLGRYKNSKEDTKSIISTGELTTLAIDGACRVMAQLPSGRFYNYDGNTGANMVMNLLFEHYVIPNAVSGGPLLQKYRMANMYSRVFPYVPMFIDWKITDKYTGPDAILIHPRRFRPQPGKIAIEDMDYCFIDTEVSNKWLKDKKEADKDEKIFKNIDAILKSADDEGPGTPTEERSPDQVNKTKTGITIRHQFLANGDWRVYAPFEKENLFLVNEKDWFSGIPIALKMQYPSLDKLGGITDFDRGHMTQKSIDSLIRMYLDGVGMSINPPLVMDPEDVVLSSIARQEKAKWFVKNSKVDSIKMQEVSPQGLITFQSTYQILKGNLLSLGATTDTAVDTHVDPGFGKTPQALKMQGARQGARDTWDTSMTQQFIERAHTIMANMIAKKGINNYAFRLLGKSIKQIKDEYPDEDYSIFGTEFEKTGAAIVNPKEIEGEYRYVMDDGSTLMKNDDTGAKLMSYVDTYNKYPAIKADFVAAGQKFNQGEAFKRSMLDDGIKDAEKIIVTEQNPESVAGVGSDSATIDPNAVPEATGTPPAPAGPDLATIAQVMSEAQGAPNNQPIAQ